MNTRRKSARSVYLEYLESRTLLSGGPTTAVGAQAITSIVAAALASAPAGDPIYMKYGNIKGSVTAAGFQNDIQLTSFQWGVSRDIGSSVNAQGERSISQPSVSEIVVGKAFDISSVPLIQQAFGGTPSAVEIDFVATTKGVLKIYLKLDLTNTLVSGYSMNSGGDNPTESLSLNFTKISISATGADGRPQNFSYDLAQGPAIIPARVAASPDAASASGSDPIYMKYGGITGDVTAKGYQGDSQLTSLQWGVSRSIGAPGRAPPPPTVSEIVITKSLDGASVPLIQQAFTGGSTQVETDFVNRVAGKLQTYLSVKLDNTLISDYSMNSGGGQPNESLSLNFTRITIASTDTQGGTENFTFDLTKAGSAAAPAAAQATPGPATAGDPIYMRYGDITGDVTKPGFEGATQLDSLTWGVSRDITSSGAARGPATPSVSEVAITKSFDSASLPLIQQAFIGDPTHVETDFASRVKGQMTTYLSLQLDNTLISSYSMSSDGGRPTESLSLNFTKITITSIGTKGNIQSFTFDLAGPIGAVETAATSAPGSSAKSAGDPIYMQYGDITGDVTNKQYKGASQLNSFQWGVSRNIASPTGRVSDREASAPSVSEITIGKAFDSASVPLIEQAVRGSPMPVETDFADRVSGTLQTYLSVKLDNTLISSYSMNSDGSTPTESLSLNFGRITMASIDASGQSENFTFDLTKAGISPAEGSLAAPAPNSKADGDPIYMKYGDIKGDVTAPGYEGAAELGSFQWSVSRSISSTAAGQRQISKPILSEVAITKSFDSASLALIQEAFEGQEQQVETDFVNMVKGELKTYLMVTLDNTLISGYSMSSGGDLPTESLSLNFTKITITSIGKKGQTESFAFDLSAPGSALEVPAAPTDAPSTSGGGGDPIFMQYGGITGSVTVDGFIGDLDLNSLQWSVSRPIFLGPNNDREAGLPSVSEILISNSFDVGYVPLIQQAFTVTPTDATIDFVKTDQATPETYLSLDLTDALVSSYSTSSGDGIPVESLSLNFTRITISSSLGSGPGYPGTFTWNLVTQSP